MADQTIITFENALNRAAIVQADLAASKLRLAQNITITPATNRANLVAAECNFTGYPSGGYNLATWAGPGLGPTGGAVITSPTVQVTPAANNTIANNCTAWWVEDSTNRTLLTGVFNPGRNLVAPTDQFPFAVQDWEGLVASLGG